MLHLENEDKILDRLEQILGKLNENDSISNASEEKSILTTEIEILKEEVWKNRVEIRRIQNSIGIK